MDKFFPVHIVYCLMFGYFLREFLIPVDGGWSPLVIGTAMLGLVYLIADNINQWWRHTRDPRSST